MLFTVYDLIILLIISFIYVIIFRIQAKVDPANYFGFGELFYGLRVSIKPLHFCIKAIIIFLFSIISFLTIKNDILVMLGIGVGSFLLVWPGMLYDQNLHYKFKNRKKIVIIIYFIFIFLSIVISWLGIITLSYLKPMTIEYVKSFNFVSRLFAFIMDGLLFALLSKILFSMFKILKKDINLR